MPKNKQSKDVSSGGLAPAAAAGARPPTSRSEKPNAMACVLASEVMTGARTRCPGGVRLRLLSLQRDLMLSLDLEDEPLRALDKAEQLAAVILHVLVEERLREFERIARSVERDPSNPDECAEVAEALRLLEVYELAVRAEGGGWLATLPAHMAAVLSF